MQKHPDAIELFVSVSVLTDLEFSESREKQPPQDSGASKKDLKRRWDPKFPDHLELLKSCAPPKILNYATSSLITRIVSTCFVASGGAFHFDKLPKLNSLSATLREA